MAVEAPERVLNYVVPKATLQLVFAPQPVSADRKHLMLHLLKALRLKGTRKAFDAASFVWGEVSGL